MTDSHIWDTPPPGPWTDEALCAQVGPEPFFLDEHAGDDPAGPARAICDACPVRTKCVEYALAHPSLDGVWGGTTAKQRKKIRAARKEMT